MSVFDDMRAVLAADLTPNELKVMLALLAEQNGDTHEVRGKTHEQLRAVANLCETSFATAMGSLRRRQMIGCKRRPNEAQIITVHVSVGTSENPKSRNFEKPKAPKVREPRNPGTSRNPKSLNIYSAPVSSAPSNTPPTPRNRGAMDDAVPANVKPVADWRTAFAHAEPEPIEMIDGKLVLSPAERRDWLTRLDADALDLALIQVAGWVRPNSSRPLTSQARAKLAEIARDKLDRDQRYAKAVASKPAAPKNFVAEKLERSKALLAKMRLAEAAEGAIDRGRECTP